jgi:hypothetical protein
MSRKMTVCSLTHTHVYSIVRIIYSFLCLFFNGKNIANTVDVKGTEAEDSYDLGIEVKGALSYFATKIDKANEDLVTDAIRKTL